MKKLIKYIGLLLLGIIVSYTLTVLLLPYITVKATTVEAVKEINIFIKSNGVHTDLVLPIKNKYYNWNSKIKQSHTQKPSTTMKYVAIGWEIKVFI